MNKILVIYDDKIADKILEEYSNEISIANNDLASKEKKSILSYKDITINIENHEVIKNGKKIDLTNKEYEILKLLMENKHKVFSRENLLDSVWGYEYFGNPQIVNTHIKNIRKKLETNCIETIRGVGYRI